MGSLSKTLVILSLFANPLFGAEPEGIDFSRDVLPILKSRCESCHGENEREGGLRFLTRHDLLTRNDSGEPAVVPGSPEKSELIRRITADELERMPPEGTSLSAKQVQILKQWIKEGTAWPETDSRPTHWAYVPPKRPEVPTLKDAGRTSNEIDHFVLARLQNMEDSLTQSQRAAPAKLLRRVYLDLIGLPPSLEAVKKFEANPSREHFEEIVDRLLASPRYGEKWTRQWLDLARYADSNGFQADQFREIWAYRDWVIQAFNSDMPFDQFTIEQLAGDLLPNATLEQKIATGFQRCTTCNVEAGVDPEENRTNQVIDRVNTAGTVWLGSTMECAQCHNHKYDPFTQQDYYQIFAYFNNTPLEVVQPNGTGVSFEVAGPKMNLPLDDDLSEELEKLRSQLKNLEQSETQRKQVLNQQFENWLVKQRESLKTSPEWHVLKALDFISEGGASFQLMEDGSVLVKGKVPERDTYTIRYRTKLKEITGFKLEALTHDDLPGKGPGRGDASRPNIVVNEWSVTVGSASGEEEATPVALHSAKADFSQKNYAASGLIDGDPKTAWAINPQFYKSHWATAYTSAPLGDGGEVELVIKISQQYGGGRTIGRVRISAMTGTPGEESIPEELRSLLVTNKPLDESQVQSLTKHQYAMDASLVRLGKQKKQLNQKINGIKPATTLVMVEMQKPRDTMIFKRGNFLERGASVDADVPTVLKSSSFPLNEETDSNRLEFAKWLVSSDNPLVARVTVNRWWAEFFGRGIVETLEDFGTQGEPPTHPQLLDWLAVEFMESGWSMKKIHRRIVLSETYCQDSIVSENQLNHDPYNKWLARGPRVRMTAEMIRDSALVASGLLSEKMGGPPIYPPQPANIWRHVGRNAPKYETDTDEDRFRRGIYVVWRRSAPYPSFVNFDAPDRGTCVVNRSRTNTPLQALTLLNDPAYVEMAHALAKRLLTEFPDASSRVRIETAFRFTLSRSPKEQELQSLLSFYESEKKRLMADEKVVKAIVPEAYRVESVPLSEQAAYFEIANILLNLDETITKN